MANVLDVLADDQVVACVDAILVFEQELLNLKAQLADKRDYQSVSLIRNAIARAEYDRDERKVLLTTRISKLAVEAARANVQVPA